MLGTCKVENIVNSWTFRDSVENGSDSSGYDTSDCGAVDALIFLRLLYLASCSKWFFLVLAAYYVRAFCLVAFSDRGTAFRRPRSVCNELYFAVVSANSQPIVREVVRSVRSY